MSFEAFNFHPDLIKAIEHAKFTRASKVQQLLIPEILEGKDTLASAHSGSGKSASFILPLIQKLLENPRNTTEDLVNNDADGEDEESQPKPGPRVLIITPTRELANQVSACIRRFTKELELRYGILVGGAPYPPQVRMLKRSVDFLVATPGRLLDHAQNNRVNFKDIEYLVIDELGRMIDMDIENDIAEIINFLPDSENDKPRQTLIFSSSLENEAIDRFSEKFQNNAVRFELARGKQHYKSLNQSMYITDDEAHKHKLISAFINASESKHICIYSHSEVQLNNLGEALKTELNPLEAKDSFSYLTNDEKNIQLALDEKPLPEEIKSSSDIQIIHLDLPDDILVFLQRLEPAIDQKSEQELIILVGKEDWPLLHQIERYIGKTLSRKKVEGLEPESSEPSVSSSKAGSRNQSQTKNRNPYSGRRHNDKNQSKEKNKQTNKKQRNNNQKRRKKNNKNPNQANVVNDDFMSGNYMDDREASWKQYISDISNGTGNRSGNGNRGGNGNRNNGGGNRGGKRNNNRRYRNQGNQNGGYDLNNSPMAISAKSVRDMQQDDWIEETPKKPKVQIKVKGQGKGKGDNAHDHEHGNDNDRIDGKLGINK